MSRPPAQEPPDSYRTLSGPGTAELKIRRSSFLATAAPVGDEAAARALVDGLRRHHHDARHVCSAWRLGLGSALREQRHDDGEPPGTAGEPILQAIRALDLCETVVAVVRYFGGIKLGTGGLGRAYAEAAQAALAAAPVRTVRPGRRGRLAFPYAQQKSLAGLLAAHGGQVEDEDFGEQVRWLVWLPRATWAGFAQAVRDQTAGRTALEEADGPEV